MIKSQIKKFTMIGLLFTFLLSSTVFAIPLIENNKLLIPLREVMENLGAKVEWYSDQSLVRIDTEDLRIELIIGENTAKITRPNLIGKKEEILSLSLPAKIVNSRTYVTEGFVSDSLGINFKWDEARSIHYQNKEYGFNFYLPASWEGYKVLNDNWEGVYSKNGKYIAKYETGPMILIRHPQWTNEEIRQDIPIMIFTINQWSLLQEEEFYIGAAPTGPKELARNQNYVFALPARYNFAFPKGFEEVENILEKSPLEAEENLEANSNE